MHFISSVAYNELLIIIEFNVFDRCFAEANPKKRKNIIHGITKKLSRLVSKYVPKQTCKHLNEQERKEESEKLQQKYTELENAYAHVVLNTEELKFKVQG